MKARKQFKNLEGPSKAKRQRIKQISQYYGRQSIHLAFLFASLFSSFFFLSLLLYIFLFFLPQLYNFVSLTAGQDNYSSLMLYLPNYFTGIELMEVTGFNQTLDFKLNVSTPFEGFRKIKRQSDRVFASCS